jgi:group I intron endonuclease
MCATQVQGDLFMPYSEKIIGIYRIVNSKNQTCYVGQSRDIKKRVGEHFRLLRRGIHPNKHLQQSFDSFGREAFAFHIEVVCEDVSDLDTIEEAFLTGDAFFDESPNLFNISSTAHKPMQGRLHTEDSKRQISLSKIGRTDHVTDGYRKKLQIAQINRFMSDPDFVAKVRFIVNNPDMSYAERGRVLDADTSAVRRLALRYNHLKGKI